VDRTRGGASPACGAPSATRYRSSSAMAGEDEGDEVRSEVGSLEHMWRRRDGTMAVKSGGGSSSSREQRRVRESSGVRGKGVRTSGGGGLLL
jgi:hypothetical protein